MKQIQQKREIFLFFGGFIIGMCLNSIFGYSGKNVVERKLNHEPSPTLEFKNFKSNTSILYEHQLADELLKKVRILCWVFTHPANHKTKLPHVRNTWGKKCDKLLFMSIKSDPDHPDIVALPIENGRSHLWNKTRLAMKYVYENHFNDAEWFMRADDDNFIVMENLRLKLYQYNHNTSLYIGHRFAVTNVAEGYMAGGGHIFSKKALEKFVTDISPNPKLCQNQDGEADDLLVGLCLQHYAIFIDARDDKNEKQIFPVGVEEHMKKDEPDMTYWYYRNLWRNVTQGGLGCCSDTYIGSHYVSPKEMHLLEFLIYNLHPYGIEKNLTEILPRKLTLEEVVESSDAKSIYSPNYKEHKKYHNIDQDEKYSI